MLKAYSIFAALDIPILYTSGIKPILRAYIQPSGPASEAQIPPGIRSKSAVYMQLLDIESITTAYM